MNRHAWFLKLGLTTNPTIVTRLINDYVYYPTPSLLSQAHQLFDEVPSKDTPLWNSLISAYTRFNHPHKALQLFSLMIHQHHPTSQPNHFVFATVARAIASYPEKLQLGLAIHAHVTKSGFIPNNVVLETALLHMYSKCCLVNRARKLFDEMPHRNWVAWNAMMACYVQNGMEFRGLELFYRMKCCELNMPNEFIVTTVLAGCVWAQDLIFGLQVHGYAIVSGFESNCVKLISNMYFHCGDVSSAERILNGVEGNATSKLIMIRGYAFNQRYQHVMNYVASENDIARLFEVDYTIILPLLTACAKLCLLKVGKQLHGLFITSSSFYHSCDTLEDGAIIGSALIDMYIKCGNFGEARKVFHTWLTAQHIFLWNSMISGYIYNNLIEDARILFEEMPEKNVVSWTSIISGYVQNGMPQEGLNLLVKMYSNEDRLRVEGNCLTIVVGLAACRDLTDLERGKQLHSKLIRTLTNADINNVAVGTALVDLYSKSGNLKYAQTAFDLMLEKNVAAWTSIITCYAVHGFGFRALEIFQQMMEMDVEPNEVTFVSVLNACSHCGLVGEGLQYFKLMREKYKLIPEEDHYTCLIDMLGRVGRLEDAWCLLEEIEDLEMSKGCSTGTVWTAMLGACKLHGNVELGRRVAKKMLESEKEDTTTYVTLSSVYAAAGMWNEAYGVRESWRKVDNVNRKPGLSRICTDLLVS
ncbi:pentatricopeptide repeat-containing protein At2g13600-like [Cornus florida]|uniref:pentatricopeptide repeat-containing protein At2g13600-like n=1 Tax=Cornus florida TaxID=4283 RepID=UPI00289D3164|nr:pentatricopeptide repeat-containing protein At2g13600-like [Cornus florida]